MHTLRQRMDALERANAARLAKSEISRKLRAGELELADAIHDPAAGSSTVYALIHCVRGYGDQRTRTVCRRARVREQKRARDLTNREKAAILEEMAR